MDNNNMFDSEDLTGSFDTNDIEQNKAISAIAYIPILFLVPMLASQSPYAKFHANQGLILTLTSIILSIASSLMGFILSWVPILPTLISAVTYYRYYKRSSGQSKKASRCRRAFQHNSLIKNRTL